ncbi:MAG: PEGA domain-containing protein [Firmicutes bacterium]|nr:PEGA domain-containing protein [Bacillota bacterium]
MFDQNLYDIEKYGAKKMPENMKKLGSFKQPEKKEEKSIWDYKPYIIIGIIAVAAILMFWIIYATVAKKTNSSSNQVSAEHVHEKGTGTLKVETQPFGAVVQLLDKVARTPATLENLTPGEYFVIIRHPKYKVIQKTVVIKEDEVTDLKVDLDHP